MTKTPLTQLIETLEEIIMDESVSHEDAAHYSVAIIHARRLLEAEKQVISKAYEDGTRYEIVDTTDDGDIYYYNNFELPEPPKE